MFGRATTTLGIGPHSSFLYCAVGLNINFTLFSRYSFSAIKGAHCLLVFLHTVYCTL